MLKERYGILQKRQVICVKYMFIHGTAIRATFKH